MVNNTLRYQYKRTVFHNLGVGDVEGITASILHVRGRGTAACVRYHKVGIIRTTVLHVSDTDILGINQELSTQQDMKYPETGCGPTATKRG